ncbi:MAG: hypothetical protein IPL89_04450 [Acidobacteria bacterium]|nr:hypothetical protein [Acidobacteriota bacterium]
MTLKDEGVLDDAVAALGVLRAAPGVDAAKVFLLGHSLGGLLAPRIALLDNRTPGDPPRGAVAPDVAGREDQVEAPRVRQASDAQKATCPGATTPRGRRARGPLRGGPMAPGNGHDLRRPAVLLARVEVPDPGARYPGLGIPVLVLQGGRDYQVSMKDFAGWQRALKDVSRTAFRSYRS